MTGAGSEITVVVAHLARQLRDQPSEDRRSKLQSITRINLIAKATLVLAVVIAAFIAVGAGPAAAENNGPIYTVGSWGHHGSARYQDYGDHVYLCDHKEDGHSVAVQLTYRTEHHHFVDYWRWNWWGPHKFNGCKDLNLSVDDGYAFSYRVCVGNHGHPGGAKATPIYGSCSPYYYLSNP
jgi:hypothetical protein